MSGFSRLLIEDYRETLPAEAIEYLQRIEQAGDKMGHLIDSLLQLSRISQAGLNLQQVNLSRIAREIIAEFQQATPGRQVQVDLTEDLTVEADPTLMRVAMQNLLGNAWKYTRDASPAVICFGAEEQDGTRYFCVKDNGAGFDMTYADKLFGPFQRLHGAEYEGTGIGLATVQRIIHRHGGEIRAEAEPGKGAKFCFTLG
jgi:signal transduction histidine kinase